MPISEHRITIPVEHGNVVGILTLPETVVDPRPGMRVVVICHGIAGHKDYCYQKILAHSLAEKQNISSFRFDFRGCGDSSGVENPLIGRTLTGSDMKDLDAVILDYLIGQKQFTLGGIVGHSRGAVLVFRWASTRQDIVNIPCIINCSGRFVSSGFMQRIEQRYPNFRKDGGYTLKGKRHGQYIDIWISKTETEDTSSVDMSAAARTLRCPVLSIYGLEDTVVPLDDADKFSQELKQYHVLRLLAKANHNFYELDKDGKKIGNHNPEVSDIITDWFSPDKERERFLQDYGDVARTSRWKKIDGVANFRDFGGLPNLVRPNYLFRSANTARVSDLGKKQLQDLNVRVIFDLRSVQEIERMGIAKNVPNCEVKSIPIFKDEELSPEKLAERSKHFYDPIEGFQNAYRELLNKAGPSYRNIMVHIRDRPNDPFVVHCTAGKDRTGVICALILLLMGVEPDTIAREYELTTVGLRDEVPEIMKAVKKDLSNPDDKSGFLNMLSSRYDAMITTISIINNEYGGAETWFKTNCELTDEDLKVIKSNLSG